MQVLCADLKDHLPEILVEWREITREEPWLSLPEEHRLNSLPDVLSALLDAALCTPEEMAAQERHVIAAAEHGRARREQGFRDALLFTEYYLLREAVWRYLRRLSTDSEKVRQAIFRIDTAVTVATSASLFGYHRDEIERRGEWPEVLQRLITASPVVPKQ